MQIKFYLVLLLLHCFTLDNVFAIKPNTTPQKTQITQKSEDIEKLLENYKKSKNIVLDVEKSVTSELLEKTTVFKGIISLSKGKMHWLTETPEKSLVLFDGSTLWTIQYPKTTTTHIQIAKTKITSQAKKPNLLTALLSQAPLQESFLVQNKILEKNLIQFKLKEKSDSLGLKDITLAIDQTKKKVVFLSYKDEVDNFTKLDFSNEKLNTKLDSQMFHYLPPKGAQITEY